MFEGKRFFPLTGIPIWKIERRSTLFAVWEPEPLTVATWRLKSLTRGFTWGGKGGRRGREEPEERRRPYAPAKRDFRGSLAAFNALLWDASPPASRLLGRGIPGPAPRRTSG